MSALFERLVRATCLSPSLAPFVVRRVCASHGVIAAEVTRADLPVIVPKLREAIAIYLDESRLAIATRELDAVLSERDAHSP